MQLKRRDRPIQLLALSFLLCGLCLGAPERINIARQADLVVVGRLVHLHKRLESAGWRISGTIVVTELLFGKMPGQHIRYEFLCSCCPKLPAPPFERFVIEGIWFLRATRSNTWESAGECSDPGVRRKSDLPIFREFLRDRSHANR